MKLLSRSTSWACLALALTGCARPAAPAGAPAAAAVPPWCPKVQSEDSACIDLTNGGNNGDQVVWAPPSNILRPNRGLTVYVNLPSTDDVNFEMTGERGITIPQFVPGPGAPAAPPGATPKIVIVRFGPRKPGPVDLVIKTKTGAADFKERIKVEFEVDQLFWGAARFGLGTLFGDFRSYDVKTFAGSQTAQINENRLAMNFEFVVGFAPYLEALCHGGRSYSQTSDSHNWHFAPYFGFGLLGQTVDKLDALTSFHMGLEFEFARDFSVATTFALRRTRELSVGYWPGSPVEAAASPDQFTSQAAVPGFGIVINASPSFLQFAMGGSAKGNK